MNSSISKKVDENGVFNTIISTCSASELTLIGFDLTNIRESDPIVTDISGLQDLNVLPPNNNNTTTSLHEPSQK